MFEFLDKVGKDDNAVDFRRQVTSCPLNILGIHVFGPEEKFG